MTIDGLPGYWMNETSGVLAPAVRAYLEHDELDGQAIVALRAYFRQWINAPAFEGDDIDALRRTVDGLTSRQAIDRWLGKAIDAGIDPL